MLTLHFFVCCIFGNMSVDKTGKETMQLSTVLLIYSFRTDNVRSEVKPICNTPEEDAKILHLL